MDYFVPNFGVDQDIIDSQSHEAAAIRRIKAPIIQAKEAAKKATEKAVKQEAAKKEADAPADN